VAKRVVRRRLPSQLARVRISVWNIGVDHKLTARTKEAVVSTVLCVRARRASAVETGALTLRRVQYEYLVHSAGPAVSGHDRRDLGLDLRIGDAVAGRCGVVASRRRVRAVVNKEPTETAAVLNVACRAAYGLKILRIDVHQTMTREPSV